MARPAELAKGSKLTLLASVCLIVAALYFSREVLIPLALAILLSFLLSPVVAWLEGRRLPRAFATILVVTVGVSLLLTLGYVVEQQVVSVINESSNYGGELKAKIRSFRGHGRILGKAQQELKEINSTASATPADGHTATQANTANPSATPTTQPTPDNPLPVRLYPAGASPVELLQEYASNLMSPLATTGLVLIFVVFMLLTREDLRDRLIRLVGHGQINLTTQAFDEAGTRITRYLGALSIVNVCYGLATAGGLWLIGKFLGGGHSFPNVLVWGLLVGLFRFVPYIGIWIGASFPIILSFALFQGNGVIFATLALFGALELIVSQFIEPYWYGASTGMSALAVLVAAVFWTWLWGPIGLLLSTPLTVILVVMGKYIPQLKFLDILLREEPVLSPHVRFYQRLVARDEEEATEVANAYLAEKHSLEAVYDELLVPALALAEHDHHHSELDDEHHEFVRKATRDIVEELADEYRTQFGQAPTDAEKKSDAEGKRAGAGSALSAAANSVAAAAAAAANVVKGGNENSDTSGAGRDGTPPHRFLNVPHGCKVTVLCLPARDEADEIVALMLAQLLEIRGYCTQAPSADALASEMVDMVETRHADLVCVSALPPAAVAHFRYLCKRLHTRFPDVKMVVGLWTMKGDVDRVKSRLSCSSDVQVVTTLHDAHRQIEQMAHLAIVGATVDQPADPAAEPQIQPAAAT